MGLGVAGYAAWKIAGPYIKEMVSPVLEFLKDQIVSTFDPRTISKEMLVVGGGIFALLTRKILLYPLIKTALTGIGHALRYIGTQAGPLLAPLFAGTSILGKIGTVISKSFGG